MKSLHFFSPLLRRHAWSGRVRRSNQPTRSNGQGPEFTSLVPGCICGLEVPLNQGTRPAGVTSPTRCATTICLISNMRAQNEAQTTREASEPVYLPRFNASLSMVMDTFRRASVLKHTLRQEPQADVVYTCVSIAWQAHVLVPM